MECYLPSGMPNMANSGMGNMLFRPKKMRVFVKKMKFYTLTNRAHAKSKGWIVKEMSKTKFCDCLKNL
jgi:hypothetical protein